MERREFLRQLAYATGGLWLSGQVDRTVWAETLLSLDQAKTVLWGPNIRWTPVTVELTDEQQKAIRRASGVRVTRSTIRAWRTPEGGWLIADSVIGKHENIDLAVALEANGTVRGLEILSYRETYGDEVRNPKWRAQFHGKGAGDAMELERPIKNISGATLSCSHITDGVRRLAHTWDLVLRHLPMPAGAP